MRKWIFIILAILFGLFLSHYVFTNKETSASATETSKKPIYWIDTMEPTVHYPGPGKSPMGMTLTPVYADANQGNDVSIVRISPAIVENLGVRTSLVTQGPLSKRIETVGYVTPNQNNISHIHTYADGWIKNLAVKAAGDPVKKGQLLLQLYSPTLVNSQEEYLLALDSGNQDLISASYKKLQAQNIAPSQIKTLTTTRKVSQLIDIYSPQDGVIATLNVREGMQVTPDTEIMSLVDLSSIWMIADIYENQASWVSNGQTVEAKFLAYPGKVWRGQVDYIYPQLDATTRTEQARFRFNNPGGLLKPNMYASITILAAPDNALSIPLEALIRSGQGDRVIVSLGDGRFQVRPVVAGMESGNRVAIISGLHPDETVVSSGQFLIDSEANLHAGLQRIESPTPHMKKSMPPSKGMP